MPEIIVRTLAADLQADVDAINRILIVPSLLDVICRTTGMGFAAIARVTENEWITCSAQDEIQFGLKPGYELQIETTICHEIRQHHEVVVIDHVAEDDQFRSHPTPLLYGFQSYISVPVMRKDGSFFGTLCAIDPKPAKLNNPGVINMFKLFADLISFHLNALEELASTESRLQEEKQYAELREQFIAVLGHDLRNPVGAVSNSADLLLRMPLDNGANRLAQLIKNSTSRMSGLINNVMDFARGKLGGGIVIQTTENLSIERIVQQVVSELETGRPDRQITSHFHLSETVSGDGFRIAQLLSNLLGNAINYGDEQKPIVVDASSNNGLFVLSVSNGGNKISVKAIERLFQPFSRGDVKAGQQGLGLGLYIASEIARAHNGKLEVSSTDELTCFSLSMPSQKS